MHNKYRIRVLGGSLLVIKGINDCVTIERVAPTNDPFITNIQGQWTQEELQEATRYWFGSEAEKR